MTFGGLPSQARDLSEGVEGYWTFENSVGANDMSGNGRHGEPKGGTELRAGPGAPIPQRSNECADFDKRVGNMIDCGPAPQLSDTLTLMAWASPSDTTGTYNDGVTWDAPWVSYMICLANSDMVTVGEHRRGRP